MIEYAIIFILIFIAVTAGYALAIRDARKEADRKKKEEDAHNQKSYRGDRPPYP